MKRRSKCCASWSQWKARDERKADARDGKVEGERGIEGILSLWMPRREGRGENMCGRAEAGDGAVREYVGDLLATRSEVDLRATKNRNSSIACSLSRPNHDGDKLVKTHLLFLLGRRRGRLSRDVVEPSPERSKHEEERRCPADAEVGAVELRVLRVAVLAGEAGDPARGRGGVR